MHNVEGQDESERWIRKDVVEEVIACFKVLS
jgi:hypothetical protein